MTSLLYNDTDSDSHDSCREKYIKAVAFEIRAGKSMPLELLITSMPLEKVSVILASISSDRFLIAEGYSL